MTRPPLSHDAATVVGLASAALPFAESREDEVERWLRPLRLYGEAGGILQGASVAEASLTASRDPLHLDIAGRPDEAVAAITAAAAELSARRHAAVITTVDVLIAVMRHYPDSFEHAVERHGGDRWELVDRLAGRLHGALR